MSDKEYSKIIYIAVTPSLPDIYKCGQTHDLAKRMKLLSDGVPEDYIPLITLNVPEYISDSDLFRFIEVRNPGCRHKNKHGIKPEIFYKNVLPLNDLLHEILEFAKKYKIKVKLNSDLFFESQNNTNFNPTANLDIKDIMKKTM